MYFLTSKMIATKVLNSAEAVYLTLPPHIFFRPSKVWIMLYHRKKPNPNLLLPSIVFHNKICIFIMISAFTTYSRLIPNMRR